MTKKLLMPLYLTVLLFNFSGFSNYSWASTDQTGSDRSDAVHQYYEDYNPEFQIASQNLQSSQPYSSCKIYSVQLTGNDPITQKSRTVDLDFYRTGAQNYSVGSVIILPPIGGVTSLDKWNAHRLCKSGLNTVIIRQWEFENDPSIEWDLHDNGALRAVTAIRHTLEFLIQQKPGPVGIFGSSLGALSSSLALSVEPRLKTGVLIVGGGSFSDILGHSKIKQAVSLKKLRKEKFHLDEEEYQKELQKAIKLDIISQAKQAEPKKLWMFIATNDEIVPTSTQWNLWEAWKRPKFTQAKLTHVDMLIYSFYFWHYQIKDFFMENLKTTLKA